jgi:hypothetical protein
MKPKMERKPLAERLEQGLREGIQFAKSEVTLRIKDIRPPPAVLAAKDVIWYNSDLTGNHDV